ncbi:MAG: Proposed peptidoglycan lipid II flippase MurJ [uncultured Phycisphaerae bacterium]|uniref:Probable lipid II flippase MurJ n=1 Tax=uncultured Phycisphaerae bacterium TaxID=904963 RepID=A0A6J4PN93_9BACT|nr:MAG: Proposed peptidoglycan lipid II flippase MurJ [uncultured Phycisphaerae bacterium]
MSTPAAPTIEPAAPDADAPAAPAAKSFLRHAKLIGGLTLLSRLVGLVREMVAAHYLGAGVVANAFRFAFMIPNLFRKLLGEGALSAAFIPLYAQANERGTTETGEPAADFAAASVNLLTGILIAVTLVGEAVLLAAILAVPGDRADRVLMLKFAAVMLPYVLLVCGGAFLSAILQVHRRFGAPAFAPVLLNVCHIAVLAGGAWFLGLRGNAPQTPPVVALQTKLAFALAVAVLVAGALQVAILLPALRAVGFRFRPGVRAWTPAVRKMLVLSIPVAIGAGVLQLSVLCDKGISYALMQGVDRDGNLVTHFRWFGQALRYPMEHGAITRLDLAQLLYQFPLGVFAIALATAIFPSLSAEALGRDRDGFKRVLRQGIEASLWEGLPASVGLILVAEPAARLLFQHGQITAHDAGLVARSTMWYAGAVWAFSMLQIVNRAYYALHDTWTPLVMSAVNLVLNLVVELPLLWWLGEPAMAVGTLVSFSVQAVVMLWMLDRRVGGLGLRHSAGPVGKMLLATAVMGLACWALRASPLYPSSEGRAAWAGQLLLIAGCGAAVYLVACQLLGLDFLRVLRRRRKGAAPGKPEQ